MFRLYRVGIKLPTIEVRYKNLNVEAESYVGSRGLPTILNTYANILKVFTYFVKLTILLIKGVFLPSLSWCRYQEVGIKHDWKRYSNHFRNHVFFSGHGVEMLELQLKKKTSLPLKY